MGNPLSTRAMVTFLVISIRHIPKLCHIVILNKSFIHRPADKDGASRDEWGEEKRVSGKEG